MSKYSLSFKNGAFREKPSQVGPCYYEFSEISGHLMRIHFSDTPTGKAMKLIFLDQNNFYHLSLFCSGGIAYALMMCLKSVNLLEPFTIKLYNVNERDRLSVLQYGIPMKWHQFENMVPGQRIPVDFLINAVEAEIIPILQKKVNPYPSHAYYMPNAKNDLQGGYFDAYKSQGKVLGPQSEAERTQSEYGKGRYSPIN